MVFFCTLRIRTAGSAWNKPNFAPDCVISAAGGCPGDAGKPKQQEEPDHSRLSLPLFGPTTTSSRWDPPAAGHS